MRDKWRLTVRKLKWIPVALPIVFTAVFFGLLPPRYDVVLYTDNIVGEGICLAQTCRPISFSPDYRAEFYFGSELKKATILDFNCDVKRIVLTISGVSEAEIEGFDLRVFGITIGHYNQVGRILEGRYDGATVTYTDDGKRVHIDFDDPNVGLGIDLVSHFAPAWFWFAYFSAIFILAILLALLLSAIESRIPGMRMPVVNAAAILITLLAGCFFCGSFPYIKYADFLLNWLFLFAVALMLNAVTLPWVGTVSVMLFTTIWYVANYFVIEFRNKPIMPADIKAIGTAVEVMGSYTFLPDWQMIVGVAVVIAYGAFAVNNWTRTKHQAKIPARIRIARRGATVVTAILLIVLGYNNSVFKALNTFAWDAALLQSFHEEGMVLTYLKSASMVKVERPDGYTRETVDGYLSEYKNDDVESIQPTNIIMVMNEAFSDLRTVGLDKRIDTMPFIDALDENVIEGSLYVSIYGGGTCNTEFEALTGNSLAFMGKGVYPYTENVTKPLFSLASYFRDNGYMTEAFHANTASNWNRNVVYPNLGFSVFHSISDYEDQFGEVPQLHKHPADIADYLYMESVSHENEGQPRFLFNVTMQNHSGYEHWEDVEKADSVMTYGLNLYEDAKIYLSLVKASDDAVRQLVETYQNSNEPTMIIFFGDHQPGLPIPAQDDIYTGVENYLDWYQSKFFIWTNYKTEAQHNVAVSANYLPYLILHRGNFPLPPYVQMLKAVYEKYPVISAMGVVDAEGNIYGTIDDVSNDPLIQKYQYIQYANLFDEIDPAWFEVK